MKRYDVVFSPEAHAQLEALFQFIARRSSSSTALRYAEAVIRTCERLALFPRRGVLREDLRPGLRLTHHRGRTVIAYAVTETPATVAIVGIFHGGQDHEGVLS